MLSRSQLKGLDPIPQGETVFTITNCVKQPSAQGHPSVLVTLSVPEDTTDALQDFVGRDIKPSLSLQDHAAFTFGNFVAALAGYADTEAFMDGEGIDDFDSGAWDPNDAIGDRIIGVVSHQLFQGRTTAQVRTFKPMVSEEEEE